MENTLLKTLVGKVVSSVEEKVCPKSGESYAVHITFNDGTVLKVSSYDDDDFSWIDSGVLVSK